MAETPNVKTLNIAEVLSGISFPSTVVPVYLDSNIAVRYADVVQQIELANASGNVEDTESLEELQDELREMGKGSRFEFHISGTPRHNISALRESVQKKHPTSFDFLQRPKPNPEGDEMFSVGLWTLFVDKIVGPDGSVLDPVTTDDVKVFRDNAPDFAVERVDRAILELTGSERTGFEALAQEHDFLSQP